MKIILLLLIGVMPAALSAQSFVYPKFGKNVRSPRELLPPKWSIKDSAGGDLNKDGRPDMALVLEYADTVSEIRSDGYSNTDHPRILLILFRDSVTGDYRPICQNDTLILREGEGGQLSDPYDKISIINNVVEMNFEFLHGGLTYKFRWQKGDFYLIGAFTAGDDAATGDSYSWDFNFSTSKARHGWKKDNESKEHEEWKTFTPRAVRLRDLRGAYSMEIFKGVFI